MMPSSREGVPHGTMHAHCSCRPCIRARVTFCGLSRADARRAARGWPLLWCPVCSDLLGAYLATDTCPRAVA